MEAPQLPSPRLSDGEVRDGCGEVRAWCGGGGSGWRRPRASSRHGRGRCGCSSSGSSDVTEFLGWMSGAHRCLFLPRRPVPHLRPPPLPARPDPASRVRESLTRSPPPGRRRRSLRPSSHRLCSPDQTRPRHRPPQPRRVSGRTGQRFSQAPDQIRLLYYTLYPRDQLLGHWLAPAGHERAPMSGLEELKKKLQPLLFDDSDKGGVSTRLPFPEDTCDSYVVITKTNMLWLTFEVRLKNNLHNKLERVHMRWLLPMESELKINIDGTFHPESNIGGWGAVIRNDKGVVKVCGAGRLENVINPLHA